jgi:hypothetical protein
MRSLSGRRPLLSLAAGFAASRPATTVPAITAWLALASRSALSPNRRPSAYIMTVVTAMTAIRGIFFRVTVVTVLVKFLVQVTVVTVLVKFLVQVTVVTVLWKFLVQVTVVTVLLNLLHPVTVVTVLAYLSSLVRPRLLLLTQTRAAFLVPLPNSREAIREIRGQSFSPSSPVV